MNHTDLISNFREKRERVEALIAETDNSQAAVVLAILVLAWAVVQVAIAIKEAK